MAGRPRRYSAEQAYEIYEKKYKSLTKQQQKLGQSPKYSMMTKSDFISDWEENRLDYKNKHYSGKQVAEALAKKDVYQHSYKQGMAIYKALEGDVDFEDLGMTQKQFALQYQKGLVDSSLGGFWNTVREHTEALQAEGYSSKEYKLLIGQMFFGSP